MRNNSSSPKSQDALQKLDEIRSKIAFMSDAVTSWPYKACDPDDDEIMGAIFVFQDMMRQIDEIGTVFETCLKRENIKTK